MSDFTGFAVNPIPTVPSPESERALRKVGWIRRMQEGATMSGRSLWGNRLTMRLGSLRTRAPRGGSARWVRYDDTVRGRLAMAKDADPANGILLWTHGGGLVAGHPKLEQPLAVAYAADARIPVFLPRYRFAPEHPFPAAADDLLAAYRALLDQGFPAERIRLGGMSAGGALTAGLLHDLHESGLPTPAAVLLVSPMLQLTGELARARDTEQPDPMSSPRFIETTNKAYLGTTPPTHPRVDHLAADVSHWPPTLIQVGGTECLVPEAKLLGARLRDAGVRCEVQVWPGQVHGFPAIFHDLPESRAVVDYGRRFLTA